MIRIYKITYQVSKPSLGLHQRRKWRPNMIVKTWGHFAKHPLWSYLLVICVVGGWSHDRSRALLIALLFVIRFPSPSGPLKLYSGACRSAACLSCASLASCQPSCTTHPCPLFRWVIHPLHNCAILVKNTRGIIKGATPSPSLVFWKYFGHIHSVGGRGGCGIRERTCYKFGRKGTLTEVTKRNTDRGYEKEHRGYKKEPWTRLPKGTPTLRKETSRLRKGIVTELTKRNTEVTKRNTEVTKRNTDPGYEKENRGYGREHGVYEKNNWPRLRKGTPTEVTKKNTEFTKRKTDRGYEKEHWHRLRKGTPR